MLITLGMERKMPVLILNLCYWGKNDQNLKNFFSKTDRKREKNILMTKFDKFPKIYQETFNCVNVWLHDIL